MFQEGVYEITVENLGCAKAEITARAKIQLSSGGAVQR
ncbi:unnamed protein product, partial [marine sediment metagenome]